MIRTASLLTALEPWRQYSLKSIKIVHGNDPCTTLRKDQTVSLGTALRESALALLLSNFASLLAIPAFGGLPIAGISNMSPEERAYTK